MKRILLIFLILLCVPLAAIFFKPQWFINPKSLTWFIDKKEIFKSWSWSGAQMTHKWQKWNKRVFQGKFEDFCFEFENEGTAISSCVENISWNLKISFWDGEGLQVIAQKPIKIHSSHLGVMIKESSQENSAHQAETAPPDVWNYWKMLWGKWIPELDIKMKEINVSRSGQVTELDLVLTKNKHDINAEALGFKFWANREQWILSAPSKYPFPKEFKTIDRFYFKDVKLSGFMKEEGIPLELSGHLESAQFKFNAYLDLPLEGFGTSFRKNFILSTTGSINIPGIKKNLSQYVPEAFNQLPAPFNVMDGEININLSTSDMSATDSVLISALAMVDLKSEKQILNFDTSLELPLDITTNSPGAITAGLQFNQVMIQLPRLSKKSAPPQFRPDSRFKQSLEVEAQDKKKRDFSIQLQALNEKAMRFKSNLLDEVLRLNFDLHINQGEVENGFIKVLPLKTTVFKRPIHVENLIISFDDSLDPVINSVVKFPLPEYKITLNIEGPVSQPRYAFSSQPPLPQNDIFAVLLFGRPLADLDPDDKTAAERTNQVLAQGILSLSVLYYLAGSPVEYIGYDPESRRAVAQIGLGSKTSLRVGGGQEGVNSSALRRSLGKGWYLDTSVQSTPQTEASSGVRNYGAILERIITY